MKVNMKLMINDKADKDFNYFFLGIKLGWKYQ